ncbi:hypothetical protein BG011_008365 [Mortierella polycephala]|uniref:Amidohydrolase-related domain-containing protein n=1 Tax=Mortierella polycephala TaxID=41804 RepID=A0A9P6PR91_9FUNG|nr:hypothetical protein BG011_008365 [Mortierella polycephala]
MADYQRLPQQDPNQAGPTSTSKEPILKRKSTILLATAAFILLATFTYLLGASNELSHHRIEFETPGISAEHFAQGVAKCRAIRKKGKHQYPPTESRTYNPRFVNGTAPTLFKNGYIFDGVSESFKGDLLIDQGIIIKVGGVIEAPKDAVVVDLKGHILTPGIVDMHSHLGVFSLPILDATNDFNEMTTPITPFIRSIDGFNPSDAARERVVSGGITSILALPGSSNIMGGEAYAFKLRSVDTLSTEDMLVEAGVKDKWRYMKMACGENPKRLYGSIFHRMPATRLGAGWLFRDQFAKATKLKQAQDDWCDAAKRLPLFGRHRLDTPFPEDLKYESLVGILRDDVKLNIHCYETHDLEAMVRHSNEFKFKISAFHHALDAYRVPEILKRAYKIVPTVATFAAEFGYKKEAFQSSVNSPKILADAGISVAIKSDHPLYDSQRLVYHAAMAHHHGLTELQALASVTSIPAKAMGLDHRIGKIAVGMDADLVVWKRHPLSLGSNPLQVYIDGVAQIADSNPSTWDEQQEPLQFRKLPDMVVPKTGDTCSPKSKTAAFTGIKKIILGDFDDMSDAGDLMIIVENDEIVCHGRCEHEVAAHGSIPIYDLGGEGVVLPSMLSVGTPFLGLREIESEDSTGDGILNLNAEIVHAVDGLNFGGLHMEEAYKAGILTGVTSPESQHVVQGVSVAFSTGAQDAFSSKIAIVKENVALHVRIGQASKSKLFPTISSQIAFLRSSLEQGLRHVFESKDEFAQVARGVLPLIVEVHNRDEIIRLIQVKKELEHQGAKIRMGLFGATEAWTVAEHLAEAEIGVILSPYQCMPMQWTAQRCLPGAPLSKETGFSVLYKARVKVGLAASEYSQIRQMPWIAAWARSDAGISEKEAVGLLSWNLADIVGLSRGSTGIVIYNGSPFEFGAKVSAIVGGGRSGVECNPRAQ